MHAVVFFNRIDSFYNPYDRTGEMLKLFYKEAEIVNDNEKPDLIQAMSAIRVAMKNEEHSIAVVINMAGQLMSSPEHLGDQEIEYLTTLFLAAKEAAEAPISSVQGWTSNLLIMVTNKVHELPTWFYRYAPFVRSVEIELPDERLRKSLFQTHANYYQDWNQLEEDDREKLLLRLLQRTEGMSCMELDGILTAAEGLPVHSIERTDLQLPTWKKGKSMDGNQWGKSKKDCRSVEFGSAGAGEGSSIGAGCYHPCDNRAGRNTAFIRNQTKRCAAVCRTYRCGKNRNGKGYGARNLWHGRGNVAI